MRAAWHGAGLAVALMAVALPQTGGARAHTLNPPPAREVLRLQGRVVAPGTPVAEGQAGITLVVLGEPVRFALSDSIRIDLRGRAPDLPLPPVLVLQGPLEALSRLSGAGDSQRVTILAERRRGAREAFVLAVDVCPQQPACTGCPP